MNAIWKENISIYVSKSLFSIFPIKDYLLIVMVWVSFCENKVRLTVKTGFNVHSGVGFSQQMYDRNFLVIPLHKCLTIANFSLGFIDNGIW